MRKILLPFLVLCSAIIGCSDKLEQNPSEDKPIEYKPERKGFFALSKGAGSWGSSASLARFDKSTDVMTVNYYKSVNDEDLGRDAADILTYGSKFYVVSSATNKIIVNDIRSGKKITEIDFGLAEDGFSFVTPYSMVSDEGYIYVSTDMGGVKVIDTISYEMKTIDLSGNFSRDIVKYKDMLFVANSGNLMPYSGEGTTLSVIDLILQKEKTVIDVPLNPNRLVVTEKGELYLSSWGDLWNTDASVHKINLTTNKYETISNVVASRIAVSEKYLYTLSVGFITGEIILNRVNIGSGVVENITHIMKKGSNIGEIFFDNAEGELYMLSSVTGEIFVMNESLEMVRTHKISTMIDGIKIPTANLNKVEFINL